MTENKILEILDLPRPLKNAVQAVLSKQKIKDSAAAAYDGEAPDFPICKQKPLTRLGTVILLLCEKYDDYTAMGVPEKIIADTFQDVSLRAKLYYAKTGRPGISKDDAVWFRHIMNTNLFKAGVLQFQPFGMIYLDKELLGEEYMTFSPEQKRRLPSGAHVINCHIQVGADLSTEAVKTSFVDAQALFEKIYPDTKFKAFVCYSWLLYPDMLKMLPPESKIKSFAENFEIIGEAQDNEQAFENLFGKAYKKPPKFGHATSLQALAAKNPKAFGFACGVKYL